MDIINFPIVFFFFLFAIQLRHVHFYFLIVKIGPIKSGKLGSMLFDFMLILKCEMNTFLCYC